MFFRPENVFKNDSIMLILCGESIARIPKAWKRFPDPESENQSVYWSENRKFFNFLPENDFLGENLCGESIAHISETWKRFPDSVNRNVCIEAMTNFF